MCRLCIWPGRKRIEVALKRRMRSERPHPPVEPCRLCGSPDVQVMFEAVDHQGKLPGEFRVGECRECGLKAQNPMPDMAQVRGFYAVDDLYPYETFEVSPIRSLKNNMLKLAVRVFYPKRPSLISRLGQLLCFPLRLKIIPLRPYGGKLLDVGCGNGAFLKQASNQGWDVWGCELSQSGAEAAAAGGLRVVHGSVADGGYQDRLFDVVRLEQVFEHLNDPRGTLQEIRRILKLGGIVIIGVPNSDAFSFCLFKRHWGLLGLPFHLYQYSAATLSSMLSEQGFEVLRIRYLSLPMCWIWSINNALNSWMGWSPRAMVFNNPLTRLISTILFFPLIRLAGMLHPKSKEMFEIIARRR